MVRDVWIEDGRCVTRALAGINGMSPSAEALGFLPWDLGDGLVLRQATADDTEAAAEFQSQVHLPHTFAESFRIWTRDLMSGALPGFQPGDFTLVEDTGTGDIVSILNLIPQTWSYGGVEISVGRIELVSTHPERRGQSPPPAGQQRNIVFQVANSSYPLATDSRNSRVISS